MQIHVDPRGRAGIAGLAGSVLAILFSTAALASLVLEFTPPAASPGVSVHVRTVGSGATPGASGTSLIVYLVTDPDHVPVDKDDPGLRAISQLAVDGDGDGAGVFVVPQMPAGTYPVYLHCVGCAPFSAGRSLLPVGAFEILGTVAGSDTPSEGSSSIVGSLLLIAGVALVVLRVAAIGFRARR